MSIKKMLAHVDMSAHIKELEGIIFEKNETIRLLEADKAHLTQNNNYYNERINFLIQKYRESYAKNQELQARLAPIPLTSLNIIKQTKPDRRSSRPVRTRSHKYNYKDSLLTDLNSKDIPYLDKLRSAIATFECKNPNHPNITIIRTNLENVRNALSDKRKQLIV